MAGDRDEILWIFHPGRVIGTARAGINTRLELVVRPEKLVCCFPGCGIFAEQERKIIHCRPTEEIMKH